MSNKTQENINADGVALYKYVKSDGSFDYESYRSAQERHNKLKINNVWVLEENIEFLSKYIKNFISDIKFGICHGTRRGKEQEWFRKYLDIEVIGTEISETATSFPNTIQWDFHDVKDEWINSVDFIYSNSFDHSYNPEQCLNAWMSCVKVGGICILELSNSNESKSAGERDPFGCDIKSMLYLIKLWGNGKYKVKETIDAPKLKAKINYLKFVIIKRI